MGGFGQLMEKYKYKLVETTKFRKELSKVTKKYKDSKEVYKFVVDKLLRGEELPEKYKNHLLEPKSKRVLIYKIDKNMLILTLTRTGSHSDLF